MITSSSKRKASRIRRGLQQRAAKRPVVRSTGIILSREEKILLAQISGSVGNVLDLVNDIEASAAEGNLRALKHNAPQLGQVLSRFKRFQRRVAALNVRVQKEVRR